MTVLHRYCSIAHNATGAACTTMHYTNGFNKAPTDHNIGDRTGTLNTHMYNKHPGRPVGCARGLH